MRVQNLALTTAFLAATAIGSIATAHATFLNLTINPNGNAGGVQATPETPLDGSLGFPCTGCTSNPVTTYGYTSPANLVASVTGLYRFTLEGAGNTTLANTFTSAGHTFTVNPPGGTGGGSTPNGTSFDEFLTAGTDIPFTLSSSDGCSISNSGAATPTSGCDYLIALASSPSTPGALGPQATAWIGFSDSPPPDADYQDLVVRVDAVPEPTSMALLGTALFGMAFGARRKNKKKQS